MAAVHSHALVMALADLVNRYGLCVTVAALADLTYALSRFHEEPRGKGFYQESGEALHSARRVLAGLEGRHCPPIVDPQG